MTDKTCSIDGCTNAVSARGWCRKHYVRWQRHGDPEFVKQIQGDHEARFMQKVKKLPNGCWEWTAFVNWGGYGVFTHGGRDSNNILAHRWSYQHFVGPIPDKGTVDHLCHNSDPSCLGGVECRHRRCVNPAHLGATATLAENVARSHRAPQNRTHCAKGHPYDEDNTGHYKNKRYCKQCHRDSERRRQREQRASTTECSNGHPYTAETMRRGPTGKRTCLICAREKVAKSWRTRKGR